MGAANRAADGSAAVSHHYNLPGRMRIEYGEGIYLFDSEGHDYIDCASGTFNLSLGSGHPEIVKVIQDQSSRLIHVTSQFQTRPVNDLVERLAEVAPPNLCRVHLKSASGSSANEGAIKIAMRHTGKDEVISFFRSHLGQTLAMTGLSGNAFRRQSFQQGFIGALHVPDPYCYRCFYRERPDRCGLLCVERINDFIEYASSGRVAAVIIEPISGNGGNIVPPPGYLEALRRLCDERGIVLIFDEIQTGIGRTGQMFAADYFGVQPHIMTLSKGLGGIGMPVAGILTEERFVGMERHEHAFTSGANVLAAAVAVKTIEIIRQPAFLSNVRETGARILARLGALAAMHRWIGDVRGVGLMIGFEVVNDDGSPKPELANRIAETGLRYGLILRTSRYGRGNVVKIRPPLVISMEEANLLCDRLELVCRAVR